MNGGASALAIAIPNTIQPVAAAIEGQWGRRPHRDRPSLASFSAACRAAGQPAHRRTRAPGGRRDYRHADRPRPSQLHRERRRRGRRSRSNSRSARPESRAKSRKQGAGVDAATTRPAVLHRVHARSIKGPSGVDEARHDRRHGAACTCRAGACSSPSRPKRSAFWSIDEGTVDIDARMAPKRSSSRSSASKAAAIHLQCRRQEAVCWAATSPRSPEPGPGAGRHRGLGQCRPVGADAHDHASSTVPAPSTCVISAGRFRALHAGTVGRPDQGRARHAVVSPLGPDERAIKA